MGLGTTRKAVERAIAELNDHAERLGWERRYRLEAGSNANGVQHRLETIVPQRSDPTRRQVIGNTYSKALRYVEAMIHLAADAGMERATSRATALASGRDSNGFPSGMMDPDARSRRPGEGR